MTATLERQYETEVPAPERRPRRGKWVAVAGTLVVAAGVTLGVIATADDDSSPEPAPAVAQTAFDAQLQDDPLIVRFGDLAGGQPIEDPLIVRFGHLADEKPIEDPLIVRFGHLAE